METSSEEINLLIRVTNTLGNPNRANVLFALLNTGDDGVKIARELGISQQAVSAIITRLVQEGLVEREGFRRGTRYHIPDKTKTLIQQFLSSVGEFVSG